MNRRSIIATGIAAGVVVIGASFAIGYWWAKHADGNTPMTNADAQSVSDNKVLYWYDPMVPNQHFDKPGKSPFMDMQLVPKYAVDSSEAAGIRVDATTQQNLGVRIAPVERRTLDTAITVAGTVGFNERELAIVQARTDGFVSRVYARAPGDVVARGAPLIDVVVPAWAGAQQEFIALRRSDDAGLIEAARDRLTLLGMPDDLVRRLERSGAPETSFTITAPIAGVIQTLDARSGMTIANGMTLAQINGLSTVWLTASVPETLGARIAIGDRLMADFPALGGNQREGKVLAVLPQTDSASRTLAVRAELPNPDGQLRPGQYARVQLQSAAGAPALVVPSEAVIRSGTRTVVIVAGGERFVPTQVQTGRENGGFTEVREGLQEGQHVVVSGQFLIDSEANLTGVLAQMGDPAANSTASPPEATLFETTGTVVAVDGAKITLAHQPVPALGWGPMTMPFALDDAALTRDIRVDDRVRFAFRKRGDQFVVERLEKQPTERDHGAMKPAAMPHSGGGQ
jgi:Cu(I)/Ag(I) efflux system membrane fusion protein